VTPAGDLLAAYDRQIRARITTAEMAADRGFRYIQVDASDDSAPVLTRLGLLPAATTIPFIWSPPAGQAGTQPEKSADA
jgi:hypothetical protein